MSEEKTPSILDGRVYSGVQKDGRWLPQGYRETPHGLLPDWAIRQHVKITPFEEGRARPGIISYGVSSYGYDARLGYTFKVFSAVHSKKLLIDPKDTEDRPFVEHEGDFCIIPAHGFCLGETVEHFDIPRDVLAICLGKSTLARHGLIVNITPLEPAWRGKVTIEISNTAGLPAKVYAGEGICQVVFLRGEAQPDVSYEDKKGIYQDQGGVTHGRVRG